MTLAQAVNSASNDVQPSNTNFGKCTCDLTPGGCDAACCCDADCNAQTVAAWKLEKVCKDDDSDLIAQLIRECQDARTDPSISDLQDGLWVYGKNLKSIFCPKVDAKGNAGYWIDMLTPAATADDFKKLKER